MPLATTLWYRRQVTILVNSNADVAVKFLNAAEVMFA